MRNASSSAHFFCFMKISCSTRRVLDSIASMSSICSSKVGDSNAIRDSSTTDLLRSALFERDLAPGSGVLEPCGLAAAGVT